MEKYLSTIAFILGLTAIINVVGFIGIYNLLKTNKNEEQESEKI